MQPTVSFNDAEARPVPASSTNPLPVTATPSTPTTPLAASSGNVANAQAQASLAAAADLTNYCIGFVVTAGGATAALVVNVTLAGVVGGTQTYTYTFPAGATVAAQPLVVMFPTPLAASAANTAITLTLPAGGAGNTNAAVNLFGFRK